MYVIINELVCALRMISGQHKVSFLAYIVLPWLFSLVVARDDNVDDFFAVGAGFSCPRHLSLPLVFLSEARNQGTK